MFSRRIFSLDFRTALEEELRRQGMTVKDLAQKAGIPPATLYKLTSNDRDVRLSTVRKIVAVLEPPREGFIAVIAAKFLLDEVEGQEAGSGSLRLPVRGYTANSIDECIIAAVRAEKEGAAGIICAPVLASIVERVVDIPVAIMKPHPSAVLEAAGVIARRCEAGGWRNTR